MDAKFAKGVYSQMLLETERIPGDDKIHGTTTGK